MLLLAATKFNPLVLLWLLPTCLPALAIHELGHAVTAALVGFRVVSCGIGVGRPLARVKIFGVWFYFATNMSVGLTITVPRELRPRRRALILMLAGGAGANFLCAVGMFVLIRLGVESSIATAFFLVSAAMAVGNLIPFSLSNQKFQLVSDGLRIAQCWRRRSGLLPPGQEIVTRSMLRDLCEALDAWPGSVRFTLALADMHRAIKDTETAQRLLDAPCLRDPRRGDFDRALEGLVRASLAVNVKAPDAEEAIRVARESGADDPLLDCLLFLLDAELAHGNGSHGGELARRAREMAQRAKWPVLETIADALLLKVEPPEDLWAACEQILHRTGARKPSVLTELDMLTTTACLLAERGAPNQARVACDAAVTRVVSVANSLSPDMRKVFVTEALKPLHESVGDVPDVPQLLGRLSANRPPPAVRRNVEILGLVAVVFLVILAAVATSGQRRPPGRHGSTELQTSLDDARARRLRDDLKALDRLHDGAPESLIDRLEDEVDNFVLATAGEPRTAPPSSALEAALREVRVYRARWPRKTERSEHDRAVERVLYGLP